MEASYKFYGKHYLASYLDCDEQQINDIDNLKKTMMKGIIESGATILNSTEKVFDNNGFTILFLLSESHCSIHTYPENNSLFTDLFTCGDTCDYTKYEKIMVYYLKPKKISSNLIIRDEDNNHS
jgi:S-adenosylmethionine decarboxylase proenzyme